MYKYECDGLINTIVFSHVVSIHYRPGADTFSVYTDDGTGEPIEVPAKFYEEFTS